MISREAGGRLVAGVSLTLLVAPLAAQEDTAPVPYEPAEFGPALRALRRGEIVAVGVFPLALLLSRVVYDYGRWAFAGFDALAAPYARPFAVDPFPYPNDRIAVALVAVGVSVTFALVDYLIGVGRARATRAGPAVEDG